MWRLGFPVTSLTGFACTQSCDNQEASTQLRRVGLRGTLGATGLELNWFYTPVPSGHSGLNLVSKEVTINLFVLGDLLSKNIWVAIATLRQHQLEKHLFSTDESGEDTDNQVKPKAVRFADGRRRTERRSSCSTLILDELKARSRSKPEHPSCIQLTLSRPSHPALPSTFYTPPCGSQPTAGAARAQRGSRRSRAQR